MSAGEWTERGDPDPPERWRILVLLGVGELLAMSPWFSVSAVAPLLTGDWGLAGLDLPLLTIAVQLGFVAGALLLAITGAADVVSGRVLFLAGAALAAAARPPWPPAARARSRSGSCSGRRRP